MKWTSILLMYFWENQSWQSWLVSTGTLVYIRTYEYIHQHALQQYTLSLNILSLGILHFQGFLDNYEPMGLQKLMHINSIGD